MSDARVSVSLDVSAVPARPAGAGRYTVELAIGLSSRADVELSLLTRRDDGGRWSGLVDRDRLHAVVPRFRPVRLLWEQLLMPGELAAINPGLHHGPHYTIPERAKPPKIATIHDTTFFDHPEWHERFKVPVFQRAITRATQCADGLIAVSQYTADRMIERFGPLPITVIPLGVDHEHFRPPRDDLDEDHDRSLLRSCSIEGDFVVSVCTIEPRKNLPMLVRAFDSVASTCPSLSLVIAGRRGWGAEELDEACSQARHGDRIVQTGFIADDVVPALLRRARAVVYPSLTEGFGLPALEALACATPLVTTRGSATEEVVGDAALLVDPGDEEQLALAIESVVGGGDEVALMRERGPKVASAYTWSACIDAHVALYRRIS